MTGGAERISCSVWRWLPLPYTRFSRSVFLLVHATPAGATLQFFGDFASGVLAWRSGSLAIPIAIVWLGDWNPWAGPSLPLGSTWGGLIPWAFYLGSLVLLEFARPWAHPQSTQHRGDPSAAIP